MLYSLDDLTFLTLLIASAGTITFSLFLGILKYQYSFQQTTTSHDSLTGDLTFYSPDSCAVNLMLVLPCLPCQASNPTSQMKSSIEACVGLVKPAQDWTCPLFICKEWLLLVLLHQCCLVSFRQSWWVISGFILLPLPLDNPRTANSK